MCVFKQGEIWWYEFTVRGKRLRKSSRTTDRGLAELIEAEHRGRFEKGLREQPPTLRAMEVERKAGRLQIPTGGSAPPNYITPTMTLKEAGMIWLEIKAWQRLRPKTLECSRDYLQHLLDFFGDKPISAIDAASSHSSCPRPIESVIMRHGESSSRHNCGQRILSITGGRFPEPTQKSGDELPLRAFEGCGLKSRSAKRSLLTK